MLPKYRFNFKLLFWVLWFVSSGDELKILMIRSQSLMIFNFKILYAPFKGSIGLWVCWSTGVARNLKLIDFSNFLNRHGMVSRTGGILQLLRKKEPSHSNPVSANAKVKILSSKFVESDSNIPSTPSHQFLSS